MKDALIIWIIILSFCAMANGAFIVHVYVERVLATIRKEPVPNIPITNWLSLIACSLIALYNTLLLFT